MFAQLFFQRHNHELDAFARLAFERDKRGVDARVNIVCQPIETLCDARFERFERSRRRLLTRFEAPDFGIDRRLVDGPLTRCVAWGESIELRAIFVTER